MFERNSFCPCHSGKKFKNCCLPEYEMAVSKDKIIKQRIEGKLHDIMKKHGITKTKVNAYSNPKKDEEKIYVLGGVPALKVILKDYPDNFLSKENWARVNKIIIEEVKMQDIYPNHTFIDEYVIVGV